MATTVSTAPRPTRPRWWPGPPRIVLLPVTAFATAVAAWWVWVRAGNIDPFFVPAPPDVAQALAGRRSYLLEQSLATVGHTVGGFTAAATAGLGCALLLASVTWLRQAIFPLLVAIQAVPKVAFAPLLVVYLGFDWQPKVALVALLSFFPIVVAALAGLTSTPAELVDLARSMRATRWQTLTKIRLRWALPQTFTGLKVAVSLSLIGSVVAELTTPNAGLGMVIIRSGQATNTALMFAAVAMLSLIGVALFYTVAAVQRLLLPWAHATTA